jgi:hypothetical protein
VLAERATKQAALVSLQPVATTVTDENTPLISKVVPAVCSTLVAAAHWTVTKSVATVQWVKGVLGFKASTPPEVATVPLPLPLPDSPAGDLPGGENDCAAQSTPPVDAGTASEASTLTPPYCNFVLDKDVADDDEDEPARPIPSVRFAFIKQEIANYTNMSTKQLDTMEPWQH